MWVSIPRASPSGTVLRGRRRLGHGAAGRQYLLDSRRESTSLRAPARPAAAHIGIPTRVARPASPRLPKDYLRSWIVHAIEIISG